MSGAQWIAMFLLIVAMSYWAFAMERFRRARSSLRGSVALKTRGTLVEFAEYGAIFAVLIGTFLWLLFSYKWYIAIVVFIMMQVIASVLGVVPTVLFINRNRPEMLFELGGSYRIFLGWIFSLTPSFSALG